ncbi:DNA-binding response regulator [Paenibacillus ferrarius]|uniref:DNA-binding response regulator n=1 Tax=Paenibacillus ferrarius TaxID=1469647 RepID=A0A1V4HGA1_9BACL|nr:response regulator transcription factor [Paenibacillus ferrarius]OPH53452.1 DNA-binding response regulator [Paenibacillus ferrarius]
MNYKVLVADDEQSIAKAIAYALTREGFTVDTAADGEEVLRKAELFQPHALVLDVMMPKLSGFDVCRKLAPRSDIGILLLTAKDDIVDKVLGLELGADDYMTKPFDLRELIARIHALCRRLEKNGERPEASLLSVGELVLQLNHRSVTQGDESLTLTPKEFDLLALLLAHPKHVFTRDELLQQVWGIDYSGGTRTVDIHIQRLRSKLKDDQQQLLQTVYGIGYRSSGQP